MSDGSRTDRERRAEVLAWALASFPRFCGLIDIVPKSGGRIKLVLNEIQRSYCNARTPRDVVLKPRQIGFTTLEQARDVYHFLTVPGARVVATCQSLTDHGPSKLLSTNYRVMFDALRRAGLRLKFRTESAVEWTLDDRDASLRIVEAGASEAAASKKGRAGTITRLHLTETAFYEYADETLNALLECVPSAEHGSEIVSESTPNGAAGVFYQQCRDAEAGRSGFRFHFFPWFMASEYSTPIDAGEVVAPRTARETELVERHRVRPEQLKWYQHKLAEKGNRQDLLDQEYPSDPDTCFLVSGRCFFDQSKTADLLATSAQPVEVDKKSGLRIWQQPQPGVAYIVSADTSEGVGGDWSGAIVYRLDTGAHVATLRGQYTPYDFARALAVLGRRYNNALIAPERNNHGHAVLQELEHGQKYPRIFVDQDKRFGWLTTAVTRPVMLDGLDDAHRKGLFKTNDRVLLGEMRTFVIGTSGKAEAARGEHDDLVMAAAIGWAIRQRPVRTVYRSTDWSYVG